MQIPAIQRRSPRLLAKMPAPRKTTALQSSQPQLTTFGGQEATSISQVQLQWQFEVSRDLSPQRATHQVNKRAPHWLRSNITFSILSMDTTRPFMFHATQLTVNRPMIYIASIYPLALHCRPGSFRTWLCFSSVTSRDCQFCQVALVFRYESVNQSNLAKLAIAAPFRGILTDWLANWLIFRHLNFKSVPKHGYFAHFDLQTWSYCRWETL